MQAHEEPASARAHQAAALLSEEQPEDERHSHKGLSIETLQDKSDSNLKALEDSPHHISESVSQELSRCAALPVGHHFTLSSPAGVPAAAEPECCMRVLCGTLRPQSSDAGP